MNINRVVRFFVLSLIVVIAVPIAADAAKFPTREIQIVTTNPPGGVTDIAVRFMVDSLSKNLGVPIIVNNRPGGGGTSGMVYFIKAKPDGYTIGSLSSKDTALVPATIPSVPYKYGEVDPLCKYVSSPMALYIKADAPWKTIEELVADARKRPGKITYAATTHSVSHFMMEAFQKAAGIKMMHIPLGSAGQTITRVLGGNLDVGISSMAPVAGQLKAGTLRALFVVAPERLNMLPQVPTLRERGYKETVITLYTGYFLPRGVPKDVRTILEKALEKTIKEPGLKAKLEGAGELNLDYVPSAAFAKEIEEDYKQVLGLVKTMPAGQ